MATPGHRKLVGISVSIVDHSLSTGPGLCTFRPGQGGSVSARRDGKNDRSGGRHDRQVGQNGLV